MGTPKQFCHHGRGVARPKRLRVQEDYLAHTSFKWGFHLWSDQLSLWLPTPIGVIGLHMFEDKQSWEEFQQGAVT